MNVKRAALVVVAVAAGIALAGAPKRKATAPKRARTSAPAKKSARGDGGTTSLEFGFIEFNVKGTATVFLDGRELGQTPLKPQSVLAGKHLVRLVNKSLNLDHTEELDIQPRQRSSLDVSFEPQ
jgi:serine/threonine-protein kinase